MPIPYATRPNGESSRLINFSRPDDREANSRVGSSFLTTVTVLRFDWVTGEVYQMTLGTSKGAAQLGLKLESTKGSVNVIVIDHIERPSEN
jgi:hypothetical protein